MEPIRPLAPIVHASADATNLFREFSDDLRKGRAMSTLPGHTAWILLQIGGFFYGWDPVSTDELAGRARELLPLFEAFVRGAWTSRRGGGRSS